MLCVTLHKKESIGSLHIDSSRSCLHVFLLLIQLYPLCLPFASYSSMGFDKCNMSRIYEYSNIQNSFTEPKFPCDSRGHHSFLCHPP